MFCTHSRTKNVVNDEQYNYTRLKSLCLSYNTLLDIIQVSESKYCNLKTVQPKWNIMRQDNLYSTHIIASSGHVRHCCL